jgi:hypothetical protein
LLAIAGSPAELRHHADARVSRFFSAELDADVENGEDA